MQRKSRELNLSSEDQQYLQKILRTRTEKASRIQLVQFILDYGEEANIYAIAQRYNTNRPKVQHTNHKALMFGVREDLDDLPRSGRKERISNTGRMWVFAIAVTAPKELSFPEEIWTLSLLAKYIREHLRQRISQPKSASKKTLELNAKRKQPSTAQGMLLYAFH